jgi:hypothetical protein
MFHVYEIQYDQDMKPLYKACVSVESTEGKAQVIRAWFERNSSVHWARYIVEGV